MILAIDLNPVLKKKYFFNKENMDLNMKCDDLIIGPGGEGIELAYLLHNLNENVILSGFLGGINGAYIKNRLDEDGILNEFLEIKDNTLDTLILSLKGKEINIRGKDPRITRDDIMNYYELFNKIIHNSDLLCLLGDNYINLPKEIYNYFLSYANTYNKKTVVRLKGQELKYTLEASPYLVLINKNDLEDLTNLQLDYEYEIIKAAKFIIEKNINILVINMGRTGSIILTKDYIYRADIENLNLDNININYGYMLAGYALALSRNYDYEMMFKLGQACGMVNSFKDSNTFDMSDIKRIMNGIEINIYNY